MPSNFFVKLAPYLAGTGATLVNLDENTTGTDDTVGELLLFAAGVIQSVVDGTDIPPLPEALAHVVAGKVTGAARTTIIIVSGPLMVAEFQLAASHPKQARALHYISQVLAALVAGKAVPSAPSFN